jgi:hypothetical protein
MNSLVLEIFGAWRGASAATSPRCSAGTRATQAAPPRLAATSGNAVKLTQKGTETAGTNISALNLL